MLRRGLLALLPLAALAAPARASEGKKEEARYVDVSPVALPIAVDGRLVNYVFVQLRVNMTAGADASKMRAKEPWFRDAIVRAGHRDPFTLHSDYTRIDADRLKATLLREAKSLVGAGSIRSVELLSQTPKQRSRLPRPRA